MGTRMSFAMEFFSKKFCNSLINMVSRAGFEPATCPLGGGRAIQLRHRDFLQGQVYLYH